MAQELDFESRGAVGNRDGKYIVVATVTDPSNLTDSIVVVIEAEDINEDPVLSGRPELTINEIDSSDENAANPDFDGNPEPVGQDPAVATVNVYNVVDEDRRAATEEWSLEGEDAGQFQLIGTVGRTLVFRTQPDYEIPADANGDNVYKITVVTLDGNGGRGEFDVCIAVMNINEEGKITLFDEDGVELVQPRAHGPITAQLSDPDGSVTGVIWQWARSQLDPPVAPDPMDITDATSRIYMPVNDDTSYFLTVTAMYTDGAEEITAGPRTAVVTAPHAVLEVEDLMRPPAFPQDAIEVQVAENSPSTTYVGKVLAPAEDPDRGTILIYTLVGEDEERFALATRDEVNIRQITVGHPTTLNHEVDHENTYTVELKATDSSNLSDTVTVTITVTDRNEAPSIPAAARGTAAGPTNNAPEFAAATETREVAENTAAGENIGAPVEATDADSDDTLTYTLGGADMASFDIDDATGQLMTKESLDFEMKDSYTIEVTASDGTDSAMVTVTIMVTDVTTGNPTGDTYDAVEDGVIDGPEVLQAVRDYFAGDILGTDVLAVVRLYFAGRSN